MPIQGCIARETRETCILGPLTDMSPSKIMGLEMYSYGHMFLCSLQKQGIFTVIY